MHTTRNKGAMDVAVIARRTVEVAALVTLVALAIDPIAKLFRAMTIKSTKVCLLAVCQAFNIKAYMPRMNSMSATNQAMKGKIWTSGYWFTSVP
jgi:hypothetical protein